MEEVANKIQGLKRKSMRLSEEAKKLMRDAKSEQKRVRTRGLCMMGNALLSIVGIRDIEQHQRIFEQICTDKKKRDALLCACLRELQRQEQAKTAQQPTAPQE
jgi:uncharacterized phage protein gp47/JayE